MPTAPTQRKIRAIVLASLMSGASTSVVAACLSAPSALTSPGKLTIGTALNSPPMEFMQDGRPTGFDVDLASALAEKMCLEPDFVNLSFQGLFPGLIAHKFDIIMARVGITPEREKTFDFLPYSLGGLRLVVRPGSGLNFAKEADVCGYSVAINAGSSQMVALGRVKDQCSADKPMTMKIFSSQPEALNELAKKSVDAAYVDWPLAAYLIEQRPDDFVEASPILSGDGPGTPRHRNGIVFRKSDNALRNFVTDAFKQIEADGTYEKILVKWSLREGDVRNEKD